MTDQWTDRLSEYLDSELTSPERTAFEAHLASCDACRTTLDELRRVVTNARALDDRPPGADLWPAVATRIGLSSDLRRGRVWGGLSFPCPSSPPAPGGPRFRPGGAPGRIWRAGPAPFPPAGPPGP